MYPFRIFVSYAHADKEKVERITEILNDVGLKPFWDRDIPGGTVFTDHIRRQIAQAHFFMPFLTTNSHDRLWVHQEIGFALGIGVPVVPITLGSFPEGMLSGIQAICVTEDLSNLQQDILQVGLEAMVLSSKVDGELERLGITTHLAEFSEERTRLLIEYAKETPGTAIVRQRAIFSSFSLPDKPPDNSMWDVIELSEHRSIYFRKLLREERRILTHHSQEGGCYLILHPYLDFSSVGAGIHRSQLEILREFLMLMPNEKIRVAFADGKFLGNITILGDWFGAKALPPQFGQEYRQTIFSHHASTVLRWLYDFDQEFNYIINYNKIKVNESRDYAIKRIDGWLRKLPH
jgi:hypothetical protein